MTWIKNDDDARISRQNISYYNEIGPQYDAILDKDEANTIIREKVTTRFTNLVKRDAVVLDFGGGTGRDLVWLLQNHYRVIFCEPSAVMRLIAIERGKSAFPDAGISFLDDNKSDFRNWHDVFPF